ncbi:MAG: hypothetical protein HYU36_04050 [Planctomycetes bacterium]|nr:hypothetical protein [Planctomycetota bacterium]
MMKDEEVTREPDADVLNAYLADRLVWLIRLRWLAIAGIFLAVTLGLWIGAVVGPERLFAVAAIMVLYNLGFAAWARRALGPVSLDRLEGAVFLQMGLDITALTVLLHYSGGAENPFGMLFTFHIAIGAMLLPLRMTLALGTAASVLHGGTVLAEFFQVLPHHFLRFGISTRPVPEMAHHYPPLWIFGYLATFILTLFGVIYFVRSITVRYHKAEALRRAREQVAQSRERMARIGEISAGVAHTVRNPLHGLLNCVDILKRKVPPQDAAQEILDLMSEGLTRIDTVTQRLLRLSRDEPLQKTATDLNDLVREAFHFIDVKAGKKSVRVALDLADLPPVRVDPNRLSEAILNVLHNAVDACRPTDAVTVRTRLYGVPAQGIRMEVEDSGEGIPKQHLGQVFDPFFTSKPIGEGTGLGLSITKRVIEEHGGKVTLESEVGNGTLVTFFLPFQASEEGPEAGGEIRNERISQRTPARGVVARDSVRVRPLGS